jgi:hypothetical protein
MVKAFKANGFGRIDAQHDGVMEPKAKKKYKTKKKEEKKVVI